MITFKRDTVWISFSRFRNFMIKFISYRVGSVKSNGAKFLKFSLILIILGWSLYHWMIFSAAHISWPGFYEFSIDLRVDIDKFSTIFT